MPGNHDVNRDDIDNTQTSWLRDSKRSLDEVVEMMQAGKAQWRRFMERLEDYKAFLKINGYDHLLTDDKNRLIYADAREVAGLRVGIAGLNSAWSCYGGEDEKAFLWCGGKYQVGELQPLLSKSDFPIGLIHHPGNWFVAKEDPNVQRLLETTFEFVLHGHEHQEWVKTDAKTGHTTIWAGSCYDRSDRKNGFNIVQLNRETGKGKVWLREYKETGRGWVANNIKKFAPQGVWTLDRLTWLRALKPTATVGTSKKQTRSKSQTTAKNSTVGLAKGAPRGSLHEKTKQEKIREFERRLCEAMVRKYDYLELFGADIPRESQRHALSVAYVSLNLNKNDEDADVEEAAPSIEISELPDDSLKTEPFVGAQPVDEVFDRLSPSNGRLLIRGVAGGGKSTLLRWASIQAAKFNLETYALPEVLGAIGGSARNEEFAPLGQVKQCKSSDEVDSIAITRRASNDEEQAQQLPVPNWRTKIPFLIRLRDCIDGTLPRPKDLPALIAKELPDPPPEWIDQVLTSGRGLLLFDGVDEIPSEKRILLAHEIENLINAYPKNYCIVSTRPGAVDKGWLSKLNFFLLELNRCLRMTKVSSSRNGIRRFQANYARLVVERRTLIALLRP